MFDLFSNYVLLIVLIGTVLLGALAGSFGVFNVLKKQSLIGDALSHATLPGVVLSFILFNNKSILILIFGAFVSTLLASLLINFIKKYSIIKSDAILALILSSFFGFGQVLLSKIRNDAGASQAGLDSFIFGQAAAMSPNDVTTILIVLLIVFVLIMLFWRHFKLYIFNKEYYHSLGFSMRFINSLLSLITIIIVIISIKSVGVILMSAILIAPAVSSRQWSNNLKTNVILSGIFGGISGFIGTLLSANISKLPTGPVIVITAALIVLISLFFAPKRGIIKTKLDSLKYNKNITKYRELIHLYENPNFYEVDQEILKKLENEKLVIKEKGIYLLTELGESKVINLLIGNLK